MSWSYWQEPVPVAQGPYISNQTPLEQLNITQDETEYLFYSTSVGNAEPGSTLSITGRMANSYLAFLDGVFIGSTFDDEHNMGTVTQNIQMPSTVTSTGVLTILSGSLGLNNLFNYNQPGTNQEKKGIVGSVTLAGQSITSNGWQHRAFLTGELLQVYTAQGASSVPWTPTSGMGLHVM